MTNNQIQSIRDQVIKNLQRLAEIGYATEHWSVEEFVSEAIGYIEATGNTTAEPRYDGLRFFTVNIDEEVA